MLLSKNAWLQVCEELLKLSVIPDKIINQYHVSNVQNDDEDAVLQIDTEESRYELNLSINEHLKCSNFTKEYPTIAIANNNVKINIKELVVEGYKHVPYENTSEISDRSVTVLKSILKSLAYNHSKSIQTQNPKTTNGTYGYAWIVKDFESTLSILYEVIKNRDKDEINSELFKDGLEKLRHSSDDVFQAVEENPYVQSSGLQKKLFLKFCGNDIVNCKIINTTISQRLPLVYDVLLCVFFFSNSKILQRHFYELLDYYYKELEENFNQIGHNISNILPYETYQKQVNTFTPYIKLEVALYKWRQYMKSLDILDDHDYVNASNMVSSKKFYENPVWKLILEVNDCLLYSKLSREDCYKVIENKLGSSDYELIKWTLVPVEGRTGYLGDYYKLKIDVAQNNERKTLHLFAKYLPTYNETAKEMADTAFEKEEFFYIKFIPELNNLGLHEITDFAPKCYFSRINDVIILEDMAEMGCSSLSKGEAMSYENILLVTKQLAKIHACSFLYEEIMTEKLGESYRIYEKHATFVKECLLYLKDGKPHDIMACGAAGNLKYLLDVFPDIPKKITMKTFKEKLRILYDQMLAGDLTSNTFRNATAHGDPWGNNIMFKRNKDGTPVECYLVDYQLVRYCPPSHELLFFLYVNSDKEMRSKCMSEIIHQYYTDISEIFKKYNYDFSKIYTYDEFLESCDIMKPKVVSLASLYLQMVLCPQELIDEFMLDEEKTQYIFTVDRKEILNEVHHNEFYRKRMREITEDLYEVCEKL